MKLKRKSKDLGKNKMDVLGVTLCSLSLALVLSHSDNRRICGFAFGYAQICSAYAPQTSHIPGTSGETAGRR